MKRRLIATAAAGVAAALTLAGCGSSGGGGDTKTVKLLAAKYSDRTEPFWQQVKQGFEAKHAGYTLNVEVVDWSQIDQKVTTLVQTQQQPDVLNYNKFAGFARDELLYPAQDVLPPAVRSDFIQSVVAGSKYDNTQYGLPLISSVRLLAYNKTAFAKAGVASPPRSWAELKAAAAKLKAADYIPFGVPLGPEEAQAEFSIWAMNNGGGWQDKSGKWAVDSPANVEALKYLNELKTAGYTQASPETTDRKEVWNLFAQGKIAMVNAGNMAPGAFFKKVSPVVDYGFAALPTKSGSNPATLGVTDYLMAFKQSGGETGNKDAVSKFLEFFYAKENVGKFVKDEGFLPVTQSAIPLIAADPEQKPFVDALPTARFAPTADAAWDSVEAAVKQKLGPALAGADPAKVLGDIQQAAEKAK